MNPSNSTASVPTVRPQRYGKQLVAHLSRRSTGEWDDRAGTGVLIMSLGRAELMCTPDSLELRVTGRGEDLAQLEDVVGRHLVRFGARDELIVRWTRDDGTAGSEQRNSENR